MMHLLSMFHCIGQQCFNAVELGACSVVLQLLLCMNILDKDESCDGNVSICFIVMTMLDYSFIVMTTLDYSFIAMTTLDCFRCYF